MIKNKYCYNSAEHKTQSCNYGSHRKPWYTTDSMTTCATGSQGGSKSNKQSPKYDYEIAFFYIDIDRCYK